MSINVFIDSYNKITKKWSILCDFALMLDIKPSDGFKAKIHKIIETNLKIPISSPVLMLLLSHWLLMMLRCKFVKFKDWSQ